MTSKDFTLRDDPFALFAEWLKEAEASEPNDPTAMALASVDENGLPDVRMSSSRAMTSAASSSTPISKAPRAVNWRGDPRPLPSSIGRACDAKCACAAPSLA